MIFLDANSTTRPNLELLREAVELIGENFANPSSSHPAGERAKELIETARRSIAESINCKSEEIVFTSGGTEANNLALNCDRNPEYAGWTYGSKTEHSSVYANLHEKISCTRDGKIDLELLEAALVETKNGYGFPIYGKIVALSHSNNETGVMQPVEQVRQLCGKNKARFHIDAVASYGKIPLDVQQLGCDTLSVSAHKVHGLQGVGALYIREGVEISPLLHGGPHERGRRAGTENKLGIVHFGLVVEAWKTALKHDSASLRDRLEMLLADISQQNGSLDRIPNTSNLWFPLVKDLDFFLEQLSQSGLMVSGQSACSSGMPTPSRVLESMFGRDAPQLNGSIRISLSKSTSKAEIDEAASIIRHVFENCQPKKL